MAELFRGAHRRLNPLTGEHVLVSPQRLQRPWQGSREQAPVPSGVAHDPACYLCPGNERVGGEKNPAYSGTFVFDNDFPALGVAGRSVVEEGSGLFVAKAEHGRCRVVCFSPRHDLTLAHLEPEALSGVVQAWRREFKALGAEQDIAYVQIFENKGALMGCSNRHPHGQIWAQSTIPDIPRRELGRMEAWFDRTGRPLLVDYAERELSHQERIVVKNRHFIAVVPFWASWPFETLVLPRRQVEDLEGFSTDEEQALGALIGSLCQAYDRLFGVSFPYSAGIHQAPTDGASYPHCTLHMHFYPPLLRSATVRKFMVGYEMLAESQRDLTPESAAERLRACVG